MLSHIKSRQQWDVIPIVIDYTGQHRQPRCKILHGLRPDLRPDWAPYVEDYRPRIASLLRKTEASIPDLLERSRKLARSSMTNALGTYLNFLQGRLPLDLAARALDTQHTKEERKAQLVLRQAHFGAWKQRIRERRRARLAGRLPRTQTIVRMDAQCQVREAVQVERALVSRRPQALSHEALGPSGRCELKS